MDVNQLRAQQANLHIKHGPDMANTIGTTVKDMVVPETPADYAELFTDLRASAGAPTAWGKIGSLLIRRTARQLTPLLKPLEKAVDLAINPVRQLQELPATINKALSGGVDVPTPRVMGEGHFGTVVKEADNSVTKHINPQRSGLRAGLDEADNLATNPNSPNVNYVDIDPVSDGRKRVSINMDDANVHNKPITDRGTIKDPEQPLVNLAMSDKASDKTIALRQSQEEIKMILKGNLALDRKLSNVMVNKSSGRPFQLDMGVTTKLKDKAAKSQELAQVLLVTLIQLKSLVIPSGIT